MRRIIVHGRVQGVNFRSFVVDEARKRPIEGWVRNLSDGSVEVVFSGAEGDVDAMVTLCRSGPRHANVTYLDVLSASADDLKLRRAGEKFSRIG
jgi:acylphosphatase